MTDAVPGEDAIAVGQRTNKLLTGILLIMAGGALYTAAAFVMPVVLALLVALTLSPLVRFLHRRGLSEGIAAGLVVLVLVLGIGGLATALSGPFMDLVDNAPRMAGEVQERFDEFRKPFSTVTKLARQVDDVTDSDTEVQKVSIQQPRILTEVAGSTLSIVTTIAIVVILSFFLLASGHHFSEQIVKSFRTLRDKKHALGTVRDIEKEISRYLFTITMINSGLGVAVGAALWGLGMPTPVLWGAIAAIVNFLPYIGPLCGITVVAIVSLTAFPTIGTALLPPLAYFICTSVEGQFITPMIVGRRLRINTVAVFIAVAFWWFLWSVPGALMAVPLLVFFKVLCDNLASLHGVGRFLSDDVDDGTDAQESVSAGS